MLDFISSKTSISTIDEMKGRILTTLVNRDNTKLHAKVAAQFKEVIMKNRSRIALLVVALFMLGTGTIAAYQSLSKTIAIVDDGKVTQYETLDMYVGDILEHQEIVLGPKDEVEPDLDEEIQDGTKIVISRWKPTVTLTLNGESTTFKTDTQNVRELLETKNMTLDADSECSANLEDKIVDGLNVEIKTKETTTKVVEEEIPFAREIQQTTDLKAGEEKIITEGKNGLKEKTVEIVQFGGEVVSETIKEEIVITKPQTEVVKQGIKNSIVDSATGKRYEYTEALTLEATAYTDIAGDRWEGVTATGRPTFMGMVAVDPKVIPLNTILYVEDYGIAIAGDTGGAIKGHDIDLFFETNTEVYNFGRRDKKVYILKDQDVDVLKERKNY